MSIKVREVYVRNSAPNGLKGCSVWYAALGGEIIGDPTSLARNNIFLEIQKNDTIYNSKDVVFYDVYGTPLRKISAEPLGL